MKTSQETVVNASLPEGSCWPRPDDSFIRYYSDLVAPEVCGRLVEMFDTSENTVLGAVGAGTTGTGTVNPAIKSSIDLDVALESAEWLDVIGAVRDAVGVAVSHYVNDITSLHLIRSEHGIISTALQLQRYEPNGEDKFVIHIDRASLASSLRELAVIVYINDVDEGGETWFPIQRRAVKPEAGRIVVFPAGFTHPHEGCPPISGPKLIATSFMCYATEAQAEEAQEQVEASP